MTIMRRITPAILTVTDNFYEYASGRTKKAAFPAAVVIGVNEAGEAVTVA